MSIRSLTFSTARILQKSCGGAALIEFALILPVLLLLMLPLYDFYSYTTTEQKVIKTGWVISDMIAMSATQNTIDDEVIIPRAMLLTQSSLNEIVETAHFLMAPEPIGEENRFGLTVGSVQKMPDDTIKIHWLAQYDGANLSVNRNPNANIVVLPSNFSNQMVSGENLIFAETRYKINPLIDFTAIGLKNLKRNEIVKTHYFPVRYGSLSRVDP